MGSAWLHNFIQLPWDASDIDQIPNPKLELVLNNTFKAVQLSTFVGTFIGGPVYSYVKRRNIQLHHLNMNYLKSSMKFGGLIGTGCGLIIGTLGSLVYLQMTKPSPTTLYETNFAKRIDSKLLNLNRWTLSASIVGLTFGRIGGFVVGLNGALILMTLRNKLYVDRWSVNMTKNWYEFREMTIDRLKK